MNSAPQKIKDLNKNVSKPDYTMHSRYYKGADCEKQYKCVIC